MFKKTDGLFNQNRRRTYGQLLSHPMIIGNPKHVLDRGRRHLCHSSPRARDLLSQLSKAYLDSGIGMCPRRMSRRALTIVWTALGTYLQQRWTSNL